MGVVEVGLGTVVTVAEVQTRHWVVAAGAYQASDEASLQAHRIQINK